MPSAYSTFGTPMDANSHNVLLTQCKKHLKLSDQRANRSNENLQPLRNKIKDLENEIANMKDAEKKGGSSHRKKRKTKRKGRKKRKTKGKGRKKRKSKKGTKKRKNK